MGLEKIIAVDAMTAESGISVAVKGALEAVEKYDCKVILVGNEDKLKELCSSNDKISIKNASQVIGMDEKNPIRAVLKKPDSSVVVAARLVEEGIAQAFVSPGNTGATGIAAKKYLKCLDGVDKIPIVVRMPTRNENKYSLVGDVGLNVDCVAQDLVRFAIMENVYLKEVVGVKNPRIALLNIGEEKSKGGIAYRNAYKILNHIDMNFVGNKEPNDIFSGEVDGFICGGDHGNYVLKTAEAMPNFIKIVIKADLEKPKKSLLTFLKLPCFKVTYNTLSHKIRAANYGGAIALGTRKGKVVITHGKATPETIRESIRVAKDYVEHDISNTIQNEIVKYERLLI